jgi:hypothetical protein
VKEVILTKKIRKVEEVTVKKMRNQEMGKIVKKMMM